MKSCVPSFSEEYLGLLWKFPWPILWILCESFFSLEVRASFNEICHKLQYTSSAVWATPITRQDREKLHPRALPCRRAVPLTPSSLARDHPALVWQRLRGPTAVLRLGRSAKISGLRKQCLHIHFLPDWHLIFSSRPIFPEVCLLPYSFTPGRLSLQIPSSHAPNFNAF